MVGGTVGEVVESKHPELHRPATRSSASLGWQQYGCRDGAGADARSTPRRVPLSAYLGVLGMPGVTAWVGLLDIGAAEGRRDGGRVRGLRRGRQRRRADREDSRAAAPSASPAARRSATTSCKELGFDACVDYKAGSLQRRPRRRRAPRASTSTSRTSAATSSTRCCALMNAFARIAVCGLIARLQRDRALRREEPPLDPGQPHPHAGLHRLRPAWTLWPRR